MVCVINDKTNILSQQGWNLAAPMHTVQKKYAYSEKGYERHYDYTIMSSALSNHSTVQRTSEICLYRKGCIYGPVNTMTSSAVITPVIAQCTKQIHPEQYEKNYYTTRSN